MNSSGDERTAKRNKYRSHEEKSGNVWLNIWDQSGLHKIGSVEVCGDSASGYNIIRRGLLPAISWRGSKNIVIGDAGFFFEKRKDAENFSLVLAMYFSGDFENIDLLQPEIFNGRLRRSPLYSERRTELFWNGISNIDRSAGWEEIDPHHVLEGLPPSHMPLPVDEEYEMDQRGYNVSEAAEAIFSYFVKHFLINCDERCSGRSEALSSPRQS